MSKTCCNGACRRRTPIRVRMSDLTGRVYAITRYTTDRANNAIRADEKHDVTADVQHLMAEAWATGWDAYRDSTPGDTVPNPYAPEADDA